MHISSAQEAASHLGLEGDPHEVGADEQREEEEHRPHGGEVQVPHQVLAAPAQRVRVLVLSPVLGREMKPRRGWKVED
jgi:uncharacterized protein YcnI